MKTSLKELALNFYNHLAAKELDAYLDCFDDDAEFEFAPWRLKTRTKERIKNVAEPFMQWVKDGRTEIKRIAVDDQNRTVWLERLDHWFIEEKWVEIPVVGILVFNEQGKVVRCSEYHDMAYRDQFESLPEGQLENFR
jgi:limonene-1,2-epoxide hydrolase